MPPSTVEKGLQFPATGFDVYRTRQEFPILNQFVRGKPLIYLDNAATTQKPNTVLCGLNQFYGCCNSNIHRGVHFLSELATRQYEEARLNAQSFLNARSHREIIFVRGATEGINLVAQSYGRTFLKKGDEIVISAMEHHANIVPWQVVCEQTGARLRVVPINDDGEFLMEEYEKLLSDRTKIVSVVHISNALGTVNPVKEIVRKAHEAGAVALVDGAQSVAHTPVDVQELDCDFFVFSGHKVFGPTGIGILYGRESLLERMPPYQTGGDMILSVTFEKTVYNELPYKFEAGTPNIGGAIALAPALDFVRGVDLRKVAPYEDALLKYATDSLLEIPGLRIIGTAREKAAVISFVLDCAHPHDIGTVLDSEGIAIRTGHHCAQPVMQRFGVPATARASFALYNTPEDVDALVRGLRKVIEVFG
jgi:cysteine desulfurase/selenocysteine lyase